MSRLNNRLAVFILSALGRGLKGVYKLDCDMRALALELPDGYTVRIRVNGTGTKLNFAIKDNKLLVFKSKDAPLSVDLDIAYKSTEVIMPILMGKKSIKQSYAEHDFTLAGDIPCAMAVVEMLNLTCNYIFPNFLLKKTSIALPRREKPKARLYAYLLLGI